MLSELCVFPDEKILLHRWGMALISHTWPRRTEHTEKNWDGDAAAAREWVMLPQKKHGLPSPQRAGFGAGLRLLPKGGLSSSSGERFLAYVTWVNNNCFNKILILKEKVAISKIAIEMLLFVVGGGCLKEYQIVRNTLEALSGLEEIGGRAKSWKKSAPIPHENFQNIFGLSSSILLSNITK